MRRWLLVALMLLLPAAGSAAQFARPIAILDGFCLWSTWAGSYTDIDEVTMSTSDQMDCYSPYTFDGELMVSSYSLVVDLGTVTDPVSSTGHVLRWAADGFCALSGGALRQGVSTIIEFGPVCSGGVATSVTLSAAQANSITDYSDLQFVVHDGCDEFSGICVTDVGLNLYWVEFEVPDAGGGGGAARRVMVVP